MTHRPGGARVPGGKALGWVSSARRFASPNCDARPPGTAVTLGVIHGISLPPGEFGGPGIAELFTNRLDPAQHPYYATVAALRVSSHFLIRRRGELLQFVACTDRAWHAGVSHWNGRDGCNDFSIGIELEGSESRRFTEAQYRRLERLVTRLANLYPLRYIAGHSDIAPGRKLDPGPWFDWIRLGPMLDAVGVSRPFPPSRRIPTGIAPGVPGNTGDRRRNRSESTR